MTDVLVVGASLAGSTAASILANQGYHVMLIDRAAFPRRKACGEGIFPSGVRVLAELGVLSQIRPEAATIRSLSMSGYGATATAQFPEASLGLGVRRELLDAALLRHAQACGVEVALGVTAVGLVRDSSRPGRFTAVVTNRGEMEAQVIVAADGLGSRLRRAAGLQRSFAGKRYGVSAHYDGAISAEGVEVFFQPGYEVYVTPVGRVQVNVAVLLGAGMARRLSGRLDAAFDDLVSQAAPRLRDARRLDEALVAGPFPAGAKQRWAGNLILAGDAAGFFDGITGEGMSLALVGAQRCAEAVGAFLVDGDTERFSAYDKILARMQRPSTLMARMCLALAARPSLGRRAMSNLARKPEVFSKLIRISQGDVALSALRPRDALALLCGL